MSNMIVDRNDPRSFHGTQAIERTTLGMSRETSILGYARRVEATYMATLQFTVDLNNPAVEMWELPPGIYGFQGATIEGGMAGAATALVEVLRTDGVFVENTLFAALPLDSRSNAWLPFTDAIEVSDTPKFLRITPTAAGTTGFATFVLQVGIVGTGWK